MKVSPAVRAEAAAWVARLHGPNRTPEAEAGFRQWLSEGSERREAFELMTDVWEKSARLRRRPSEIITDLKRSGVRLTFSRAALAALAIAVVAAIGTKFYLRGDDGLTTAVGEQRTLALEDGTRVYLNTNSRAVVHYDKAARRVELEKGEALFEVTKRPDWPFIVTAGDRQVRALGTSFIVRRDSQQVAVTLVEGKVTVSPMTSLTVPDTRMTRRGQSGRKLADQVREGVPAGTREVARSRDASGGAGSADIYTLAPGERLTFGAGESPQLDQPAIERITAWQRGQVELDNTPLEDAVAEMNRYSTTRLIIDDPAAETIRVSGIFRAGDSEYFAQAVARSYGLSVANAQNEIFLRAR
jgi:transmembrane sensor